MRIQRKRTVVLLEASSIIILLLIIGMTVFHGNKLRTLSTLEKIDDRPIYMMSYRGDYGFSDFLKSGATNDEELEKFVYRKLLLGNSKVSVSDGFACTVFSAQTSGGERLVARNFDHPYTPILVLFTEPTDGYRSVSTVNLAYMGFGKDNLPTDNLMNRIRLLGAPYVPFDGMNEKGLVMALLAVPESNPPFEEGRPTVNTTTAIRLVLDKAATVYEAISLIEQHNIYFSAGIDCHYLISDELGDSAVVEFVDGEIKVVRSRSAWQAVTNFILSDPSHPGDGHERYERASELLTARKGVVSEDEAMTILDEVSIPGSTQWSAVYNQALRTVRLSVGEDYEKKWDYSL